jgi:exodeoxyribonuclease V alpha subunit
MSGLLEQLVELKAVGPLDHHFARLLERRAGVEDERVLAAAALAGSATTRGHVCVELNKVGPVLEREFAGEADGDEASDQPKVPTLPEAAAWRAAVAGATEAVRTPGEDRPTPLVLDGDALYLDRLWIHQRQLVAAIEARRPAKAEGGDPAAVRALLGRLFKLDDPRNARQIEAVATAVARPFTVVAGGPGTGKTAVVVRLLAMLTELARKDDRPPPRVALMAPTGKAAARLTESIRATRDRWIPEDLRADITDEASTIHRRLKISPKTGRPRFDADNPLPVDLVVVDEASMVALPLMARVFAAVPSGARLVLLGDPDQLVSVEMGAVLGDIRKAASGLKSKALELQLAPFGVTVPANEVGDAKEPVLADSLVTLEYAWRYEEAGADIEALAAAINDGDPKAAVELLEDDDHPGVRLVKPGRGRTGFLRTLKGLTFDPIKAMVAERDPAEALAAQRKFRVLCAHRRTHRGVETVNEEVESWLEDRGAVRLDGPHYVGRPLLVGSNDPRHKLYNGDVGVVLADPDRPDERCAWFEGSEGEVRRFSLAVLPEHATVYATTVHKSQGSEYDEVVVVLPERPSPLLTRELLYTAVTRAKAKVTIVGEADRVIEAVEKPSRRMSGLSTALARQPD